MRLSSNSAGHINTCSYVGGNPISLIDPRGLDLQITGGIGGLIGVALGLTIGGILGGGVNVRINSSAQVVVNVQGSVTTGVGAFAGGGVQYGIGYNGSQTCPGDSGWTPLIEGNVNAGFGPAKGGSVNLNKDSVGGQVGGRQVVGFGIQTSVGIGVSRQWTWQLPFTSRPQTCTCTTTHLQGVK